jgi:hypothetical protein
VRDPSLSLLPLLGGAVDALHRGVEGGVLGGGGGLFLGWRVGVDVDVVVVVVVVCGRVVDGMMSGSELGEMPSST